MYGRLDKKILSHKNRQSIIDLKSKPMNKIVTLQLFKE